MGNFNSVSSQCKAIRKRETVLAESQMEDVLWKVSVSGDIKHTGEGKVMLTNQKLYLFNKNQPKGVSQSCNQQFTIGSMATASIRSKRPGDDSDVYEQHLAISFGDTAASQDDIGKVLHVRMMDETSGRVPPKIANGTEIVLRAHELEFLSNLLEELNELRGVRRDPEHYVERMLHVTSGRVGHAHRFMLHHSSGRAERSSRNSECSEEGEVTMDMMRFTSGRASFPPRFSAEGEHSD